MLYCVREGHDCGLDCGLVTCDRPGLHMLDRPHVDRMADVGTIEIQCVQMQQIDEKDKPGKGGIPIRAKINRFGTGLCSLSGLRPARIEICNLVPAIQESWGRGDPSRTPCAFFTASVHMTTACLGTALKG